MKIERKTDKEASKSSYRSQTCHVNIILEKGQFHAKIRQFVLEQLKNKYVHYRTYIIKALVAKMMMNW